MIKKDIYDYSSDEDFDELGENIGYKPIPNILSLKGVNKIFMKAKLINGKLKFERKARSNSPKESGSIKVKGNIKQHILKQHSPNSQKHLMKGKIVTRNGVLYSAAQFKSNAESNCKLGKVIYTRGASNSPQAEYYSMPEDFKGLTSKRNKLNEELLEEAESGNTMKIMQLLKP